MPTSNSSCHVRVVGSLNIDIIYSVRAHGELGHTPSTSKSRKLPGGLGGNQAVAVYRASHLKHNNTQSERTSKFPFDIEVSIIAKVGNDPEAATVKKHLEENHIDTTGVSEDPKEDTGTATIRVDAAGISQIDYVANANHSLLPDSIDDCWSLTGDKPDIVLTQLEIPPETVCKVIELAKSSKVPVILNLKPKPEKDLLSRHPALFRVDHIIMNHRDADSALGLDPVPQDQQFWKDREKIQQRYTVACGRFHTAGASCVVITLGKAGAIASYLEPIKGSEHKGRKLWFYPAKEGPDGVVDETGASDAFVGAYTVDILRQLREHDDSPDPCAFDIGAALEMGIKAGGLAVGTQGTMDSMPYRDQMVGPNALQFTPVLPFHV